ncbi:hypothetical protein ACHAWF_003252, partial [Thalassiosira exigua]
GPSGFGSDARAAQHDRGHGNARGGGGGGLWGGGSHGGAAGVAPPSSLPHSFSSRSSPPRVSPRSSSPDSALLTNSYVDTVHPSQDGLGMGRGGRCAFGDGCEGARGAGLAAIDDRAFANCGKLVVAMLCDGLGTEAFYNCTYLKSIKIPSSVTAMGTHSFIGCKELKLVELCDGLQKIGNGAFRSCASL